MKAIAYMTMLVLLLSLIATVSAQDNSTVDFGNTTLPAENLNNTIAMNETVNETAAEDADEGS